MEKFCYKFVNVNKDNNIYKIIHNFNFEACYGSKVCIFGNSGVGKTLLLEILGGISNDFSGDVFVLNENRKFVNNKDLKISYMMKEPVLLERLSVQDNVAYVFFKKYNCLNTNEKFVVDAAIGFFKLEKLRAIKVKKLSLLERKVLNLCRIYCKKPDLILLDEPFYGLNAKEKLVVSCMLKLLTDKYSATMLCVDNGQNLMKFNGFKFFYLQICQNLIEISTSSFEEKSPDIYCYFLIKYGCEFDGSEKFFNGKLVSIVDGRYLEGRKQISIGDKFIDVINVQLLDIYHDNNIVKLYVVGDNYFDAETGLRL